MGLIRTSIILLGFLTNSIPSLAAIPLDHFIELRNRYDDASESVVIDRIPELSKYLAPDPTPNCVYSYETNHGNAPLVEAVLGRFKTEFKGKPQWLISPPIQPLNSEVQNFLSAEKTEFETQDRDGALHIIGVALSTIGYSIEYKQSGDELRFLGRFWHGRYTYEVAGYCTL